MPRPSPLTEYRLALWQDGVQIDTVTGDDFARRFTSKPPASPYDDSHVEIRGVPTAEVLELQRACRWLTENRGPGRQEGRSEMKSLAIAATLAVLGAAPAMTAELVSTVSKIVDGDTFDVRTSTGKVRIRFCGIDMPERGQAGFNEARTALERTIDRKQVRSRQANRDRLVAQCFLGATDVATELARGGYACDWPKFSGGHYRLTSATCVR